MTPIGIPLMIPMSMARVVCRVRSPVLLCSGRLTSVFSTKLALATRAARTRLPERVGMRSAAWRVAVG